MTFDEVSAQLLLMLTNTVKNYGVEPDSMDMDGLVNQIELLVVENLDAFAHREYTKRP